MVTRGGIPEPDQRLATRLFRDAFSGDRYRVHFDRGRREWRVYHCGREILDGPRRDPAAILDYLRAVRVPR